MSEPLSELQAKPITAPPVGGTARRDGAGEADHAARAEHSDRAEHADPADGEVLEDLLVEEVSIDGMCGVY